MDRVRSVLPLARWYVREVVRTVRYGDWKIDWPTLWEGRSYLAACDRDFPKAMRIIDDQHRKIRMAEHRMWRRG